MEKKNEFIFGVQYYRAPTPSSENWETDLANMKANGFTDVKFWVQWGWTHRAENEFYFDDIDKLMDIAYQNDLRVTLNVIFDVAPKWIFDKYPESKMILANGKIVEPIAVGHRQIGGFPGTCYNHRESFEARCDFLRKTVERYKDHPALDMWDVWNEPEQCGYHRYAKADELSCFCDNCKKKFALWLEQKYLSVEKLNDVWGRCYKNFSDIDLPRERFTFSDFIDFREFHLDKMTNEANVRLRIVKEIDKIHTTYLHVVPNTSSIFNSLTGVDDFELAKECDVFASTNFSKPIWSILTMSAGRGKTCYNVECHIGNGSTKMHQKQINIVDMTNDLLPQIGMGIRGFLFWQYRPEVLGHESPAWGATNPDGTIGSVGLAAKEFIEKISPYKEEIMKSVLKKSEIAIWKGRKNEILSYCINDELSAFAQSIEAYINAFYYNNFNCFVVNDEDIKNGLKDVKLLILPQCYEADRELLAGINSFIENGGTVLCEAHFGGYDADKGRHSYNMPGVGASDSWGIKEEYTTSSYYLDSETGEKELDTSGFVDDVKKAVEAYGINGGKNFQIKTEYGFNVIGAERFAKLSGGEIIGTFNNIPCIVKKEYGKGKIVYCGTNLGEAASVDNKSFVMFLEKIAIESGVQKNGIIDFYGVHIDKITDNLIVVNNNTDEDVRLELPGDYKGVYFSNSEGNVYVSKAKTADLCVKVR